MTETIAVVIAVSILACILVVVATVPSSAQAPPSWSWTAQPPNLFSSTPVSDIADTNYCARSYQSRQIEGIPRPKSVCTYNGDQARFGTYFTGDAFAPVVSVGLDAKMYHIGAPCDRYDTCLYIPEADMLVTKQHLINGAVRSMVVYKNFSQRITTVPSPDGPTTAYSFNTSSPDFIYKTDSGYAVPIGSLSASENGKWLAVEMRERGIGIMNLETFEMRRIAAVQLRYGFGLDPSAELAVSNDGRHVAVMGYNAGLSLYDVDSECAYVLNSDTMMSPGLSSMDCPRAQIFGTPFIDRFYVALHPTFNAEGSELRFYAASYDNTFREVVMRAAGFEGRRIDYLALGDSFSSGEGETDDARYLPGTNVQFEKCHLSDRSYPFLISQAMGIEPQYMRSVACSGARMGDITGRSLSYNGQSERMGDNGLRLVPSDLLLSKQDAKILFKPGRIHQVEFAKDNNPKVITIGIGGNDAGFSDKLKTCLGIDTCEWAASAKGRLKSAQELRALFPGLVDTYSSIHQASPQSKIYVIGYPNIVGTSDCDPVHGLLLNQTEREFLREAVVYLNKVVAAAAEKAGVMYIDITNSMGESALCGRDKPSVMNGITIGDDFPDIQGADWFKLVGQESFHPRPIGHEMIGEAILSHVPDLRDYRYCIERFEQSGVVCPIHNAQAPRLTDYWLGDQQGLVYESLKRIDFMKKAEFTSDQTDTSLGMPDYSFEAGSEVSIEVHSDPYLLGTFQVSASGSLLADISLPDDLAPGYHTVHIVGKSYSGEPVDVYQVIKKNPIEVVSDALPQQTSTVVEVGEVENQQDVNDVVATTVDVVGLRDQTAIDDSNALTAKIPVQPSWILNIGPGGAGVIVALGWVGLMFGGAYAVYARLRRR